MLPTTYRIKRTTLDSYGMAQEVRTQAQLLAKETSAVHWAGHVNDLPQHLTQSDIFLLTSRDDPQPIVALEALASDLPVFCFDSVGTVDILPHEFICTSPSDMGEKMRSYLARIDSYPPGTFRKLIENLSPQILADSLQPDASLRERFPNISGDVFPMDPAEHHFLVVNDANLALAKSRYKLDLATADASDLRGSHSYRLGHLLTEPARLIRKFLRFVRRQIGLDF